MFMGSRCDFWYTKSMTHGKIFRFIASIAKVGVASIIGAFFTTPAIGTWYATLTKPALNPPNWIFGPVWTILYICMGVAVFFVWSSYAEQTDATEKRKRRNALIVFDVHLALNAAWSMLFFGLQNPLLAFVEIIVLWCAIVWVIIVFYPLSRKAAYLLLPYLAWVSFAAYLNYFIWILN